jgi:hypothetical protein
LHKNLNVRIAGIFQHFLEFYMKIFTVGMKVIRRVFVS